MGDARRAPVRWAWLGLAYACLAIGMVGIVVPVLPTTPFILLSAFAADRGSPRLHAWLVRHRVFGPAIRDWRSARSIARRAKLLAVTVMAISVVVMAVSVSPLVAVPTGAFIACVAVWIWTRPEPRPAG